MFNNFVSLFSLLLFNYFLEDQFCLWSLFRRRLNLVKTQHGATKNLALF